MSAPNEIQLLNYPANAQLLELGDVSHVLGDKATATTHPELPTKNMGKSTFHDENVNIWPKTSQN